MSSHSAVSPRLKNPPSVLLGEGVTQHVQGQDIMKTGTKQQLDPNRRSNEAKDFEVNLRRKIVGQDAAIEKFVEVYQIFLAGLHSPGRPIGNLLFLGPTGTGKCLARGTPVLMFDGTIKNVENVAVGDSLMGPDSKLRTVLSLAHGWDEMYDIVPVKGDKYTVNEPHILSLTMTPAKQYGSPRTKYPRQRVSNTIINLSVKDYLTRSKFFKHRAKGYRVGVEFAEQALPIDPYFFGLWLGDGTSCRAEITSDDVEIIEAVYVTAAAAGMQVTMSESNTDRVARWDINTGTQSAKGVKRNRNSIVNSLRALGVLNNKHIPMVYKANSRENRLKLLAGLMDSDGGLSKNSINNYDYVSQLEILAKGVAYVARSLGLAAYVTPCKKKCQTGSVGTYYRVCISGDTASIPVRVARKVAPLRKQIKNVLRTGITVLPAGYGEYFGFEIDGDGLFLLGDFTVTHNTRSVEAVAETLYGDLRAVIKIDCAEFQHSHEIAKLIGSPPGYLGHRETHPLLTQEALNACHTDKLKLSLLLFDEIEKASDSLWQLLLGMLDKATLTLGDNRRVDLSQCIIILTSNLGSGDMIDIQEGGSMGFTSGKPTIDARYDTRINDSAVNAAKRKFTPEFMNRIDKVVVFNTLRNEHLKQILEIELDALQQRVFSATRQFCFVCTDEAKDAILTEGTDIKYGARHLKRVIERRLTYPLANLVATGQVKFGDRVSVDLEGQEFTFTRDAEGMVIPILLEKYSQLPVVNPTPAPVPAVATAPKRRRTDPIIRDEPDPVA
jgi:ATP-dependent Clp protease ATP-binding subunit ClpB